MVKTTAVVKSDPSTDLAPQGVEYNVTSLVLPDSLSYEQWAEIGSTLAVMEAGHQWWIGDWLLKGENNYGEKYSQAIEETGRSARSLANLAYVASRIPPERRLPTVGYSVSRMVAPLEPHQQSNLLAQAAEGNWTVKQMQDAVKALKGEIVVEAEVIGEDPVEEMSSRDDIVEAQDDDLLATIKALQAEIEELRGQVETLSSQEQNKAVAELIEDNKRVKGMYDQARLTAEEHRKDSVRRANLLEKVRKALAVEKDSQVLSTIKSLAKAANGFAKA